MSSDAHTPHIPLILVTCRRRFWDWSYGAGLEHAASLTQGPAAVRPVSRRISVRPASPDPRSVAGYELSYMIYCNFIACFAAYLVGPDPSTARESTSGKSKGGKLPRWKKKICSRPRSASLTRIQRRASRGCSQSGTRQLLLAPARASKRGSLLLPAPNSSDVGSSGEAFRTGCTAYEGHGAGFYELRKHGWAGGSDRCSLVAAAAEDERVAHCCCCCCTIDDSTPARHDEADRERA